MSNSGDRVRVLVVDDHQLLRQGIIQALGLSEKLEVCGEAASGEEALEWLSNHSVDVVLMDISMPGMNGIEASQVVRRRYPKLHILLLTIHAGEEYVLQAIRAGVDGYVIKDIDPPELIRAILTVAAGASYLHPGVTQQVLKRLRTMDGTERPPGDLPTHSPQPENTDPTGVPSVNPREVLSERELEVLRAMSQGMTNQEIADHLFISEKTVRNHATNLFRKLKVSDRTQAVIDGLRRGWVQLPGVND